MKNLIKSAVVIGQVLGLVMGENLTTASWQVSKRYPYASYRFF